MRSESRAESVSPAARREPTSSTVSGMMLSAVPPWIEVTESTACSFASHSRLTSVCSAVMICAAMAIGSTPCVGVPLWQPQPCTVIAKRTFAAIAQPGFTATVPTASGPTSVPTCCPNTAPTCGVSSTPSCTSRSATPLSSSPAWKINRTGPGSRPARRESSFAAPRSIAVCASCPQACMFPFSAA